MGVKIAEVKAKDLDDFFNGGVQSQKQLLSILPWKIKKYEHSEGYEVTGYRVIYVEIIHPAIVKPNLVVDKPNLKN